MSWENILKRPFDVGAAQQTELQGREDEKQKQLALLPSMLEKHIDPKLKSKIASQPSDKKYYVVMPPELTQYIYKLIRTHGLTKEYLGTEIAKLYPNIDKVILHVRGPSPHHMIFTQN